MTLLYQSQFPLVRPNVFTMDKTHKKATSRSSRKKNSPLAANSGRNFKEEVACEEGLKEYMRILVTEMKS